MDLAPDTPSVTLQKPTQELSNLRQRQRDRLAPRNRTSKDDLKAQARRQEDYSNKEHLANVEEVQSTKVTAPSPSTDNPKTQCTNALQSEKLEQQVSNAQIKISPAATDAFAAGREGRQFTVGGVGNNGRIYLRPTARPANQKYTQPRPIFPTTPPSTAGLEALAMLHNNFDITSPSLFTPTHSPTTPYQRGQDGYFGTIDTKSGSQTRHQRRRSNTTGNDQYGSIHDSDAGAFKVIIERPKRERRPNTADASNDPPVVPVLEVPIPHYRLGTPRFSMRGTAFLRNSSYTTATATEDVRSSVYSKRVDSTLFTLPISTSDVVLSRRHSFTSPQPHFFRVTSPGPPEPEIPVQSSRTEAKVVDPKIFDSLSFPPKRDDQAVVRYSAHSGSIVAATPPRLVAEITSSKFLDYDLLSDFFLTFRSFMSTQELLMLIIARLRWSLSREDEVGMVVRVRTFVALRHWILNYFMDDYVLDYELRKKFCELLNGFVDELLRDPGAEVNKLRILGELKKCWRRTCALYWDGPEFSSGLSQEIPITSGGIAGHRDASLTPSFWETSATNPPNIEDILHQDQPSQGAYNFFAEVSSPNDIPEPMASVNVESDQNEPPTSPRSQMSFDAVSCSIPTKAMRAAKKSTANNHPLAAHPVSPSALWGSSPPTAAKPKATPKHIRPGLHKRNDSFSDSLRDDRQDRRMPIQKALFKSTELLMALPYAGSLVRGNMFPPGQPFVEAVTPATPSDFNRLEMSTFPENPANQKPSAMSGPGMKKLLGNVRRALSTRVGNSNMHSSPTMGSFPHMKSLGGRGVTTNRVPGTAVVPQTRSGSRKPMRIDVLGAGIAEDFKKAVREDEEAQFHRMERASHITIGRASGNEGNEPSNYGSSDVGQSVPPTSSFGGDRPSYERGPLTDMTTGSKSIVIIDDTLNQSATMSGGLQNSSSMDTFTDAFMHRSAGPTPPLTPPEQAHDGARQSSHLLGSNMYGERRSVSMDPIRHASMAGSSRPVSDANFSSPLPGLPQRLTQRTYGRSFQSRKSLSLRRYASYQSGFTRKTRERSFDATTFTESVRHNSSIPSLPPPLRLLRRVPGGDLRAADHIGDLNAFGLRRAASTGSITTYSDSIRSSYMLGRSSYIDIMDGSLYSQPNIQRISLGALADPSPKHTASFYDTHSSQPPMRPSFEAEAAKLAQIPDDDYDDGGVESALLKLEGKFETRRSQLSVTHLMQDYPASPTSFGRDTFDGTGNYQEEEDDKEKHLKHVVDSLSKTQPLETRQPRTLSLGAPLNQKPAVYQPTGFGDANRSFYSEGTEQTYSSIPLLDRSDGDIRQQGNREGSNLRYASRPQSENLSTLSHPSIDFVEDMNNVRQVLRRAKGTVNCDQDQSFLHVSRDDYSDISSEMSMEVISPPILTAENSQTFTRAQTEPVVTEVSLKSHSTNEPPSPPFTVEPQVHESQLVQMPFKPLPPTPDATPTVVQEDAVFARPARASHDPSRTSTHAFTEVSRESSVHLPFILAFDSEVLAQQFTLIEKDALNEIDWKELIDMRWRNTSTTTVRSWVEFLRTQEPRGLEVVIARFNVMVKWAVSECVLTSDINERARCITKLIHIAAHCRKLRNYATMYQLTVALTTKDVSRLSRTWAKIPASDLKTLSDLESLVQPARNFHELRAEMESASTENGCIPFVGIYTHDLIFNAERPSVVSSTDGKHELINFEKFRMTAHIVKNLLRLLEASGAYEFAPIEGITERCLWMAALTDDEIRILGEGIERPNT